MDKMSSVPSAYSRKNPFPARLSRVTPLTAASSGKETLHFEVAIAGSNLRYEVGDSLGVFPSNDPREVDEIHAATGLAGSEDAGGTPLRELLLRQVTLREPSRQLLAAILEKCPNTEELAELIDPEAKSVMDDWIDGREVIDILKAYPQAKFTAPELAKVLRKLQPRLYSIASSPRRFPEDVHLTIAVVRYELHGRKRHGVCSTFLAERAELRTTPVPVFVTHSHFRVPEDGARDIIMVGPGTGIAPFRAFVQERAATGATGRNWLFFGDQRRATDFLYEDEWEESQRRGVLTRLDVAFSRDQAEKVYVQDRMRAAAAELWAWLEGGASFYVCGDAKRMAKDVDAALHEIVAVQGGLGTAGAVDYVKRLKQAHRYLRDVY